MKSFEKFISEGKQELPLGKMSLKAASKDAKAHAEKDVKKKHDLENQGRMIRMTMNKADKSR